jgi:hypothetical protein
MCIIGCSPKLKLYDFAISVNDGFVDLDNINSSMYHISQIKIPTEKIIEFKDKELLDSYIKELIKPVNFFMNDYLYQGCIVYCKGTTKSIKQKEILEEILKIINFSIYHGRSDIKSKKGYLESLRPTNLNLIEISNKLNLDIRLLFVFSTNKCIKSYFFSRDDWIHIIEPKLTTKYLKQNKHIKREDYDKGFRIFFIESIDEINKAFINKLNPEYGSIAILCKNNKVLKKLKEMKLKGEVVALSTWI